MGYNVLIAAYFRLVQIKLLFYVCQTVSTPCACVFRVAQLAADRGHGKTGHKENASFSLPFQPVQRC